MEECSHYKNRNRNPRDNANLLSFLGFIYTLPIFSQGYRKRITEDDIYETFSAHKSTNLGERSIKLWEREIQRSSKTNSQPSLKRVFMKLLLRDYLLIGVGVAICELIIRPSQVFLLGELIMCYSKDGEDRKPIQYAMGIVALSITLTLVSYPLIMECYHLALKIRVICCSLIYRKTLRLTKTALTETTPGKIINLISNDVAVFDRIIYSSMYLWAAPIQTIILASIMYKEVGTSSLFGVAISLFFVPFYYASGKAASILRLKTSMKTDQRLRLMNEIIQGIRVIKMYAWEVPFSKTIGKIRNLELHSLKLGLYIKSCNLAYPVINAFSLFAVLTVAILLNQTLTARTIFMLTAFFFYIGLGLNYYLPVGMVFLHELFVAFRRITDFLLCDDILEKAVFSSKTTTAISIQNCTTKRDKSSPSNTFDNINLDIQLQNLTAIIGSVGSGKTSLLHTILGEILPTTGEVVVNGSLSYASQEPWIFSSTIRQNILFGREINEERYNSVIRCCALETDLKLLPYGDKTTVGEKGASLSGGQKARISLARAIYKEADIYLLDDPLSAVDAKVGKQIFEQCIQQFLYDKTVVLVTHQLQYLAHVNYIVALHGGEITAKGTKADLEGSGFDFVKYLPGTNDELETGNHALTSKSVQGGYTEQKKEPAGKFTGIKHVEFDTYKRYFLASKSYALLVSTVLLYILVQLCTTGSYYYLAHWVNTEEGRNFMTSKEDRNVYFYTYSSIIVFAIVFTFFRSFCFVNLARNSSHVLHGTMFHNVAHATIDFFSLNSSGVILNRFAKDMAITDDILAFSIMNAARMLISVVAIFVVVSVVNPLFLIPSVCVVAILHQLRKFYLATHLNVLRVEGQVRGPLYGHVNASLQGLTTIRAMGNQKLLQQEFYHLQDTHSSAFFTSIMTSSAFSCWLDLIVIAFIAVLAIYYSFNSESYGGNVGLVISQAMQLTGQLAFGVKQITDVESFMISIERILEYNSIKKETRTAIENLPPTWPDRGEIKFENVNLRYAQNSPYVLKDVNLCIRPLEKIGIVGRTGAGKSSLISALFQLVEIEGSICIDGVNIRNIGLQQLRAKISIIPQDPVLFSGSMRFNLDPFEEYADEVLWKALEDVQLKHVIGNLKSEITMDGSNFSVGQRQLICLARAIVRNNKILVLDEATANVDNETDAVIQKIIRSKFGHCTVLTVAHRLNTIMDSDRVLVMNDGAVVEFEHPHVLLQNKDGPFYSLVQQTERTMTQSLGEIATEGYNRLKGRMD
ncbi:hypothetical protein PPYR_09150 [Photinus pyralis]|uniref:Uncharacterized protein n=2 Tax=Photinus pyralis TaxID=7054 RepID=A0A5N4ALG2_PHOPY|nr:probable multidrug resistance-associated protein lethal(2)03659 isoform X1 [Photinus pyralis]KAB0798157.1 hypothetical protein PPYR_09150 [Photinus pyralis]